MEPVSLSPIDLFLHAGLVGRAVMILLVGLSVWCWVLIAEGALALRRLRASLRAARTGAEAPLIEPVLQAGRAAGALVIPGESLGETRARLRLAMDHAADDLAARAEASLPPLAIIASVAPFIGLFGTVWGIMVSFSAIAAAQDTSLAVVAPGIAEALAATAIGLAAAIPASVGYTRLGAALGRAQQELSHLIDASALALARPAAAAEPARLAREAM